MISNCIYHKHRIIVYYVKVALERMWSEAVVVCF